MVVEDNLANSALLLQEAVTSFCEATKDCQLLQVSDSTDLLIMERMNVTRRTTVGSDFILEQFLQLPGFDLHSFPFILVQSKYTDDLDSFPGVIPLKCESIDLLNVQSGELQTLVRDGSAQSIRGQQSTIFIKRNATKFDLEFSTTLVNE